MEGDQFTFEEFKNIVNILEHDSLDYFVFGGYAYDGFLELNETHEDLDIVFFEKDKERILSLFSQKCYDLYSHGRKYVFQKKQMHIDVLFLKEKSSHYELLGNIRKDIIPKEAILKKNVVDIDTIRFTIMPFEWFQLYGDEHRNPEKKEKLILFLKKSLPYCDSLDFFKSECVKKPNNMDQIKL